MVFATATTNLDDDASWAPRARACADFVPAGAKVLHLGEAGAELERALPSGCQYHSAQRNGASAAANDVALDPLVASEGRDLITCLGVLESLPDPLAWLRRARAAGLPLVCSYDVNGLTLVRAGAGEADVTLLTAEEFERMARQAGFELRQRDPNSGLCKLVPREGALLAPRPKKVLTLSYYNDANFGDRLGYHLVNALVPASATVVHATVKPWTVPDEDFDLLLLGTGHSLNAATVQRPELHALLARIPHTVGIFGTQYRYQYRKLIDPAAFDNVLDRLTMWWARNEEDVLTFGAGRTNVRHLGDWLITAFPNATPTIERTLDIPPEIKSQEAPLDRLIQRIQSYRRVNSARIHPLLCALTSADAVAYREQHEDPNNEISGKFRSMLVDIFGRTYPEGEFFDVDHAAVRAYKTRVERNVSAMKQQIADLLDG
jgi:hypothetical protein